MKISCQSCQAKYTIADEKVLGKVVKIRCKKCSSTIVINGNDAGALAASEPMNSLSPGSPVTDLWTVNVAEGDQRTLSTEEVVAEFGSGVIHDETFCWREGMDDWLPLREIDELREAVGAHRPDDEATRNVHDHDHDHAGQIGGGEEHTILDNGGSLGALFGGPTAPTQDAPAAGGLDAGHLFGDAGTGETAARRSKGRGVGGTDLFGGVSQAGGEEEQAHAGPAFPSANQDDVKLTGQRNESSVLFSLNALTSQEPNVQSSAAASASTTTEGSGLIDIRALSASANAKDKPANAPKVDDIMNLSGGGAFGAALAAPVLAAPSYSESSSDGGGAKSNKMIFAILGGFALLAAAIFGGMVMMGGKSKTDGEGATAAVGAMPSAQTTTAAAAPDTTAPAAPAASVATPATPATATPKAPTVGAAPPVVGGGGGSHAAAAAPAAKAPEPEPPPAPAAPPPPKDLAAALGEAAGQKPKPAPAAAAATDAPFDRGAAAAALGNVNVQSCKKPDGPTGTGRVKVTFAPSGSVQTAVIDGAPFEGTPVGSCVAGKFRGAHIPAFAGSPVTAGKSFTIN